MIGCQRCGGFGPSPSCGHRHGRRRTCGVGGQGGDRESSRGVQRRRRPGSCWPSRQSQSTGWKSHRGDQPVAQSRRDRHASKPERHVGPRPKLPTRRQRRAQSGNTSSRTSPSCLEWPDAIALYPTNQAVLRSGWAVAALRAQVLRTEQADGRG